MKNLRFAGTAALIALATLSSSAPSSALCWGSLVVQGESMSTPFNCPFSSSIPNQHPVMTRIWQIGCFDGCGHATTNPPMSLQGFGQCFKRSNCQATIICLPIPGPNVQSYNPPMVQSSIANRKGSQSVACETPVCVTTGVVTASATCACEENFSPTQCAENDPLIVSLGDARFLLTDRPGGVSFDLGADGKPEQIPWTRVQGDEAFLVLDRNFNGTIDDGNELFGDVTPQHASQHPNGFEALAMFDDALSGGNEDGRISAEDRIFDRLQLWTDVNHNGFSEAVELHPLSAFGLEWIELDYEWSSRTDEYGNEFRFHSSSGWTDGKRTVWNVFLTAP